MQSIPPMIPCGANAKLVPVELCRAVCLPPALTNGVTTCMKLQGLHISVLCSPARYIYSIEFPNPLSISFDCLCIAFPFSDPLTCRLTVQDTIAVSKGPNLISLKGASGMSPFCAGMSLQKERPESRRSEMTGDKDKLNEIQCLLSCTCQGLQAAKVGR